MARCSSKSPECPNFLNRKDCRFDRLNGALQTVFKALRDDGVGATIKHAAVISADEEELLWSMGTIGEHTFRPLIEFCQVC